MNKNSIRIRSIRDMHRMLGIAGPHHPLVSVVNFRDIQQSAADFTQGCSLDFYMIAIKKDFKGKVRYGQSYYDFDEGVMSFIAPGQVCYEERNDRPAAGSSLLFHADLIRGYALDKGIKQFEFFSYAINEALYLSKKEERTVEALFKSIRQEYEAPLDRFSQNVMVSQIEVLLHHADRFYNRQFMSRKPASNDLLVKLDGLLDTHFNNPSNIGLPTVKELADTLHVSPSYLSDMLRVHTGQNTQQHIHHKLIEKAKQILSSSNLTIAEIAYQLGFEHPQSFSKIFKRKTNVSPLEFRQSFN
ncbi:helix-turn-helix transcriptional regulator [Fulvivirgaceae bacterium PWU5]|uniref:Helix-turn-helix transcriptional regulator n=1 Tax=Dawidia cretensis TaxID=2782350 RepID=A0AAP2E3Y2_9BACT|nr:response regulator transcription factor [Dawidia cretensis]MBT1711648.1 helix-turn-helix transcriptional regulator [Dawidia cretensis]